MIGKCDAVFRLTLFPVLCIPALPGEEMLVPHVVQAAVPTPSSGIDRGTQDAVVHNDHGPCLLGLVIDWVEDKPYDPHLHALPAIASMVLTSSSEQNK